MTRRTFLLFGLAILAVIVSHAAGWGQTAMIQWTNRYEPVAVPDYEQVGSFAYYWLLVVRQLVVFAIPAFLFCSGCFVAYASRGNQPNFGWKMVRTRLKDLLIPYTIWSVVCFVGDALQGNLYSPVEYIVRFTTGQADGGGYYFVPLLIQFYVLSPFLVRLAKNRWRWLLSAAAIIQFGTLAVRYGGLTNSSSLVWRLLAWLPTHWLLFSWAIFFPLGLVFGVHTDAFRRQLARFKRALLLGLLLMGALAIVEPELIYRTTGQEWRFLPLTISTSLYALLFILCFLAFDQVVLPLQNAIYQVGTKSYAIYLIHIKAMEFFARVIRQVAPWILANQVLLFSPIMVVIGLGIPFLMTNIIRRSRARPYYRYLFG